MTSKENARLSAGQPVTRLLYTLYDFKTTSPIIDADSLQAARFARGRPSILTEVIIAWHGFLNLILYALTAAFGGLCK